MKRATLAHHPLPASALVPFTAALLLAIPMGVSVPTMRPTVTVWPALWACCRAVV